MDCWTVSIIRMPISLLGRKADKWPFPGIKFQSDRIPYGKCNTQPNGHQLHLDVCTGLPPPKCPTGGGKKEIQNFCFTKNIPIIGTLFRVTNDWYKYCLGTNIKINSGIYGNVCRCQILLDVSQSPAIGLLLCYNSRIHQIEVFL
ncbi:uncharacterized protein LOC142233612 isoform X2 [Haematobia irritans]|uniref:uncharacterized protein LOC142233612 isoform X2 n=1 Tax=Haematobia irritans TaxID=7368 RepID=UPI003F4F7729